MGFRYIDCWTYEADTHCHHCTVKRFGENALCNDTALDNEGNPVHPVFFANNEYPKGVTCGTCREEIDIIGY